MAHFRQSGGGAAKPRIRRLLEKLADIREACGLARLICCLPMPRYVGQRCCVDSKYLDNILVEEVSEVHEAARSNSRSCLLAAIPGCIIFNPRIAFGDEDDTDLASLVSSGGVSIWKEGDPVHLTDTAYGEKADYLLEIVTGRWSEEKEGPQQKQLESVVTRSTAVVQHRPLPGWIIGGNQGGSRGCGNLSGQPRGRGRGARGRAVM